MVNLCLMPISFRYSSISEDIRFGPLSDLEVPGTPYLENCLSKHLMITSELVDLTTSPSTHPLKSSTRTSTYSPAGIRPSRSNARSSHTLSGILVVFTGGVTVPSVTSWHPQHSLHFCSASLSKPGLPTWCPSCGSSKTLFLKTLGITILVHT